MDLYMQLALLALIATSYAYYSFYSAEMMNIGETVFNNIYEQNEDYSMDSSQSADRIIVSTKLLPLWVNSTSKYRDVYIDGSYATLPTNSQQYMYYLYLSIDSTDLSTVKITELTPSSTLTSRTYLKYNSELQSHRAFVEKVATLSGTYNTKKIINVYPIDFYDNGKLIYVITYK